MASFRQQYFSVFALLVAGTFFLLTAHIIVNVQQRPVCDRTNAVYSLEWDPSMSPSSIQNIAKKHLRNESKISTQQTTSERADAAQRTKFSGPITASSSGPYDSFTDGVVFGLGEEIPSRRLFGERRLEQDKLLRFAVELVNKKLAGETQKVKTRDLVNGLSRLDHGKGMEYELVFGVDGPEGRVYHRVKIQRIYKSMELVEDVESFKTSDQVINLVLPLYGRQNNFRRFLKRFGDCCIMGNVHLTIVHFGKEDRDAMERTLNAFAKEKRFTNYKVVHVDNQFSLGLARQTGVSSWKLGNDIMFFCDVDMYFDAGFLERCRFYTEPGKRLYYPIVFSLYNPDAVYGVPDNLQKQARLTKLHGRWRDTGYGMLCVYRDDFLKTKGFDLSIRGWGKEDVDLHKKFMRTSLSIVRATDRQLFHIYHPKECPRNLPTAQYNACLSVKAIYEGSQAQMSKLAFGNDFYSDKAPDWKARLRKMNHRKADREMNDLDVEISEMKTLKARLVAVVNKTIVRGNNGRERKTNALTELRASLKAVENTLKKLSLSQKNDSSKK